MFKIKICGITNPEDALLAAEAGADAIGLNFYEQSPRYVTPERAQAITRGVREKRGDSAPRFVGVFVNSSQEEILEIAAVAEIDGIQLHGDELPEQVAELNMLNFNPNGWFLNWFMPDLNILIVRAVRCREPNLLSVSDYLKECAKLSDIGRESDKEPLAPQAVLLDAYQPGAYGGTGQVVDWNIVRNERDLLMGLPVILAGGLTPENVAEAIATARPDAVDVASGVESSPGKKDPEKVRQFIAEARRAFEALSRSE
ncbi:MAG TPA: phosphoribosylanthranilate isomerase [Pirellulaceae bacterium]|nr:phosphoribosylanthranilate isomerase [Pirellulaceae bacterium]